MVHRVVIVGGGFAGLQLARGLADAPVEVTLVDKKNHHLFQPLLYQVATGELTPASIAAPLRGLLRHQKNCRVLLGNVDRIDLDARTVAFDGRVVPYDTLVLAAGARHAYFGRDEWERDAPGLKTLEDAMEMRARLFRAFEAAEREEDKTREAEWLTFVIVGAGPTGVELAGALSETAHHALEHDFRSIDPSDARIVLVEAGERALAMYPSDLSTHATHDLERLHVEVRTRTRVVEVAADKVVLEKDGVREELRCRTVLWAAGSQASAVGRLAAAGRPELLDRTGRLIVERDCSLAGRPEVFAIGDLAHCKDEKGAPLPALATVAMQQGRHVARVIEARLAGAPSTPFVFEDPGQMAVVGRFSAVAMIGRWHSVGLRAWLVWLFVHLMQITLFRNRLLVLVQWGWTFFTRDRGSRLITTVVPPEQRR
jgi:NADH dehydrogenase